MNMRVIVIFALGLAACQNPTSAQVPSAQPKQTVEASRISDADIRCFLVAGQMLQRDETKAAGMMAGMYFMGKMMASNPTEASLEAEIRRVVPTVTDTSAELRRCGTEMTSSGAITTRIGGRLTADGL